MVWGWLFETKQTSSTGEQKFYEENKNMDIFSVFGQVSSCALLVMSVKSISSVFKTTFFTKNWKVLTFSNL